MSLSLSKKLTARFHSVHLKSLKQSFDASQNKRALGGAVTINAKLLLG